MKSIVPYLLFNGNCREAMNFYKDCFGGNLEIFTFADAPDPSACGNAIPDQIMHAALTKGDFVIMASDDPMGSPKAGNTISLSIPVDTIEETKALFNKLAEGGNITMPLSETFWAAQFGMLTDKYGFHWMLNCDN